MSNRYAGATIEALIQYGYRELKPKHIEFEDYLTTMLARLHCAELCLRELHLALSPEARAQNVDQDIAALRASESCVFFLGSCLEVLGQILNLCCRLRLAKTRTGFIEAIDAIKNISTPEQLVALCSKVSDSANTRNLYAIRHRVTHGGMLPMIVGCDEQGIVDSSFRLDDRADPMDMTIKIRKLKQVSLGKVLATLLAHVKQTTSEFTNFLVARYTPNETPSGESMTAG